MTRYQLVRRDVDTTDAPLIVAQGQPEDGFSSATEAAIWATDHALDWRWYIHPIVEVCKACRGTGVVYENHGQGMYEPLACDCPLGVQGDADG